MHCRTAGKWEFVVGCGRTRSDRLALGDCTAACRHFPLHAFMQGLTPCSCLSSLGHITYCKPHTGEEVDLSKSASRRSRWRRAGRKAVGHLQAPALESCRK